MSNVTKQGGIVLDIIRSNGYIERAIAFQNGIANLTAVIAVLRKNGYPIGSRKVQKVGMFGKTHYTEYYLREAI